MFLLPQRFKQGAEIFNLKDSEDLKHYNVLLGEVGFTVRILSQREFMVGGSAHPANEFGEGVIKPDALYLFVCYERTQDSPYKPKAELLAESKDNKTTYKSKSPNVVIEVEPGDNNESVIKKIESAIDKDKIYDPDDIVIEVEAREVKEKPVRKKAPPKKDTQGAKKKGAGTPKKPTRSTRKSKG